MRSRRYKKKGPVRSKKVTYDGITFQSGLEKYMYIALKKAKIKAKYEGTTYELIPSFNYDKSCYLQLSRSCWFIYDRPRLSR